MRLLLIEDDLNLAHQLQHNLEASGYIVDVSGTLSDARYMTNEISYDIIVMDLGLPDGSGLSLLTEWRQSHKHTPVLVLTARDNWDAGVIFLIRQKAFLQKIYHKHQLFYFWNDK